MVQQCLAGNHQGQYTVYVAGRIESRDRSQLLIQARASLDGSYCSVAYLKTYSVAPVQCEPRKGECQQYYQTCHRFSHGCYAKRGKPCSALRLQGTCTQLQFSGHPKQGTLVDC